jgi:chorismate mutase
MHTLLGDPRAADDAFSAATLVHERLGAPAFVALTKAAQGRALVAVDPQRAGALLAEAQHSASTLGLAGVVSITSAER